MICWKCRKEINVNEIYRNTECPLCKADLHCCKACSFFSPESHYNCKESVDENIVDKERSNFCDFFRAKTDFPPSGEDDKSKRAKDAFNALFG